MLQSCYRTAWPVVPAATAAAEVTFIGRLRRRVYGPLRPFRAAEILARASGLGVRPFMAAAILARVSGLTSWPFWAADILARASSLAV